MVAWPDLLKAVLRVVHGDAAVVVRSDVLAACISISKLERISGSISSHDADVLIAIAAGLLVVEARRVRQLVHQVAAGAVGDVDLLSAALAPEVEQAAFPDQRNTT